MLHAGHSDIAKTYNTALQLYYWPNMKKDIEDTVNACQPCQEQRNSNSTLGKLKIPSSANQPMLEVGCDLFSATGKQWLVLVGWTRQLCKLDTKAIIATLES